MNSNKKLSSVAVLLSSYNGEKYIEEQIESILDQKDVDLALIIRDDSSTDNTRNVLKSYMTNSRITIKYGVNRLGASQSFLSLLKCSAKYDYISLSDQDDIWPESKLKEAIKQIEQNNTKKEPVVYASSVYLCDTKGDVFSVWKSKPKKKFSEAIFQNSLMGNTIVFNKEFCSLLNSFDLPKRLIMHDWWIYLTATMLNAKILYDETPRNKHRQHPKNTVGVKNLVNAINSNLNELIKGDDINSQLCQFNEAIKILGPKTNNKYSSYFTELNFYRKTIFRRVTFILKGHLETRTFIRKLILSASFIIHGK